MTATSVRLLGIYSGVIFFIICMTVLALHSITDSLYQRMQYRTLFERETKMEITEQFEMEIKPFYWVKLSTGASVCLTVDEEYLQDIFDTRADDGFIGNGYDWASLAHAFLNEKCPELREKSALTPNRTLKDIEGSTIFPVRSRQSRRIG